MPDALHLLHALYPHTLTLHRGSREATPADACRWVDLGAQLRKMKTGVGCQGYPVSGYLRCKSKAMKALSQRMMQVSGGGGGAAYKRSRGRWCIEGLGWGGVGWGFWQVRTDL